MDLCAHWFPLTARGEQTHQRGDPLPLHRVVNVPLFLAALEKASPAQDVEVMGQGRPRDLDRLLDLSNRHFPPGLHQQEEDLQPTEMGERLERLDVRLVGGQLRQRQAGYRLHVSKYMKISNRGQALAAVAGRPRSRVGSGNARVGA